MHLDYRISENPCFNNGEDCPERNATCHATCDKWKKWEKIRDSYRKDRYEKGHVRSDLYLAKNNKAKEIAVKKKYAKR